MTGQDIVNKAQSKIGCGYELGILVPKDDANYSGKFDCAEYVSWALFQAAGILYGCANNKGNPHTADAYTGYMDRDAHSLGKIITLDEAAVTPGAAVIRIAATGQTSHIVLSRGDGSTAEAHSSADGCINLHLANRRWDYGILFPGITYTKTTPIAPVVTPPQGTIYRLTSPYMISAAVGRIQTALTKYGYSTNGIDNIFGMDTYKATKLFQFAEGITPDGEVGPVTAKALGIQL